jgi:hypothetical protein
MICLNSKGDSRSRDGGKARDAIQDEKDKLFCIIVINHNTLERLARIFMVFLLEVEEVVPLVLLGLGLITLQ